MVRDPVPAPASMPDSTAMACAAAPALALQPEWDRLALLAQCLLRLQQDQPLAELEAALPPAQAAVERLRADGAWDALIAQRLPGPASGRAGDRPGGVMIARPECLAPADLDLLAAVAGTEAVPALGRTCQALQGGLGVPQPTPALLHEWLFLAPDALPALLKRLAPDGVLQRAGLLQHEGGLWAPVQPGLRLRAWLWGHATAAATAAPPTAPPGTLAWPVRAGLADLVATSAVAAGLREMVLWHTQRERLEQDWGARLGGGPVGLFAGPSGTGKTLAAEVLAHELGCRLWTVDLGRLVSKYVGETERNLSAVFDAAEGAPVLLLFDEADALFGRRAEVKDARDRYANMEVSHLLTRIERHLGPCVLTTNLRGHLDPAFLRRFHVVVEFTRPDAAARQALWLMHLPPRAPCAPGVDAKRLADAVALTGAQIRNAAQRAALLAAGDGQPIGLGHLALAVWRELAKDGRELSRDSLGELGQYVPPALAGATAEVASAAPAAGWFAEAQTRGGRP